MVPPRSHFTSRSICFISVLSLAPHLFRIRIILVSVTLSLIHSLFSKIATEFREKREREKKRKVQMVLMKHPKSMSSVILFPLFFFCCCFSLFDSKSSSQTISRRQSCSLCVSRTKGEFFFANSLKNREAKRIKHLVIDFAGFKSNLSELDAG